MVRWTAKRRDVAVEGNGEVRARNKTKKTGLEMVDGSVMLN
jgi:hypothetical protein